LISSAEFCIWIRIGSGFNQVSGFGSGSRRAKMTHKNRKSYEISCFEAVDVLCSLLRGEGFSFMEA
jgi:hypothetical protein